jgi:hypothetical protein
MKISHIGICVCLAAAVLNGCARRQVEVHDVLSPDGKITLRIELDETGGAAVADVTSSYLFLSDAGPSQKQLAFKGSAMSSFDATWRGSRSVVLSYGAGYVSACNAVLSLSAEIKVDVVGCR